MIKQVVHIGITVKDMEKSLHFYRDIMGLKFVGELIMEGKETDILFNKHNAKCRVCYLNGSDEMNCPAIELIQFIEQDVNHEQADLFKTSISEICFNVIDIDKTYTRLKNLGVEFISEPQNFDFTNSNMGKSKAVYFKDPDGVILELIQTL